jgi:hypothetical protein
VNAELSVLERALPPSMDLLNVGGRIVVMSYQSLEDRLVKRVFADAAASTAPAGLPVELPEHAPRFRLVVKGAELASEERRRATRGPHPCVCARPNASGRRHERAGEQPRSVRGGCAPSAAHPGEPARRLHAVEQPAPRRRPRLVYGIVAVSGAL